jgi:hypothetical protein
MAWESTPSLELDESESQIASPSPMALKFVGVFSVGDVATLHPNRAHGEAPSFF